MQNTSKHVIFAQLWIKRLFSEVKIILYNSAACRICYETALAHATDLAYLDRMSGAFQQQLSQSQLSCSASPPIIQKQSPARFTHPLHMWAHWWLCIFRTRDISEYLFSWKKIRNEEGLYIFWRVGRGKTCCIYQRFWVLAHGPVFSTFMPPWFYNKCFRLHCSCSMTLSV